MTALEPALRAVMVTALMVLVGVPTTLTFVVYPEFHKRLGSTAAIDGATGRLLGTSAAVALLCGTLLAASGGTVRAAAADPVGLLAGTETGVAWLALAAGAVVVWSGVVLPSRFRRSPRADVAAAGVGGLVMLLAFCLTRYSTAVSPPETAILVKFGHMAGAAFWVGGLAVMAALPSILPEDAVESRELAAILIQRFSIIAVGGVTLTTVSGVLIASWHVRSLDALLTTAYGLTLTGKVVLVSVAAALGGLNRLVLHDFVHPDGDDRAAGVPGLLVVGAPSGGDPVAAFVRIVRVELAVLVGVLLLSVLLTTAFTPAALGPDVGRQVVRLESFVHGFPAVLRLTGVAATVGGALVLGYELGEFDGSSR